MSPMDWFFLSMFFLLIYFLSFLMIYFTLSLNVDNFNLSMKKIKLNYYFFNW